ncbi:MAG: FeoA family protein [Steroidobacteraceae bacterium]
MIPSDPASAPAPAPAHTDERVESSLARLGKGARGIVVGVLEDQPGSDALLLQRRLVEVGFVAGERFEIIEQAWPGGDPIAVRIGASLFALRRREAEAVRVRADP